jgi:hypothetical protein
MSHIIADRVKEKFQSPAGTGILSLLNTTSGYRRFSSVMSSGDTCYYCLECPSNGDWECGLGTYSSNNALSRTTVYSSSNSGAIVNFANRVSYAFISYVASRAIYLDPSGELNLALTTLSDVSLTAPASGESLKYNGSSWVNGVVSGYTTEEAQDAVGSILLDTSSVSFSYNDGTPSISASVKNSGITDVMISGGVDALKIGSGSVSSAEFGYLDGVTSSLQVQLDSKYASANPSGFISAASVASAYQPLDADLTSLASASGSGIYERSGGSWTPVVIGTGLSLGSGILSNTLDLSSYLTSSVATATYVPYTGATGAVNLGANALTCGAITASGTILTRNGTSPTSIQVTNTYTSATSFGLLDIRANAAQTAYEISSFLGSAGGANLPINIGHRDSAGTFTSALSIGITGSLSNPRGGTGSEYFGASSGNASSNGLYNTSFGSTSLTNITNGSSNCSFGRQALQAVTSGGLNSGFGLQVLNRLVSGSNNTAFGAYAGFYTLGSNNTYFGFACLLNTTGSGNVGLGYCAGQYETGSNAFYIDNQDRTNTAGDKAGALLYGTFNATPASQTLVVNAALTSFKLNVSQPVSTSGSPTAFTLTGAAHTTLTLSTEATDVNFNLSRTVQFATGALTTQRAMRVQAPTYSFVGASTITTASTLSISGAPVAGTNATITNAYALNVESGTTIFNGPVRSTVSSNGIYFSDSGNGGGRTSMSGTDFYIDNGSAGGSIIFRTNSATGTVMTLPSTGIVSFNTGVTGSSNIFNILSGTSSQTLRVYNTYTSSTSYETLNLKGKAAANFEIGPENGSAGGTLRGLTIGGYSAGTTTIAPWLTFTSAGVATFAGAVSASNLSGTNTGDQDLSSYATTASVVAGYVALTGIQTVAGAKTFTSSLTYRVDGGALSQTFQCYNPSTANGVQILNYKARGSLATPLYPAANDIILGHYCYGHDELAGAFSGVKASYICSIPDAWTDTSNSTQWTWVTTDTLDATKTAANRMRLQSDGSLTIGGITQSGGLLELVKSNTGLTGFGTALNRLRLSDSDTTTAANQPIGEIEFYSYDATAPGASVKGSFLCVAESATPAAAFVWGLDTTTGAVSEVMRLSSAGLLSVEGGIKTSKGVYQTTETTSTPAAGAVTIDLTLNNHQTLSLTSLAALGTSQVTFTPPTGSSAGTLIVKQHASASKDITTWAVTGGTIKWMGTEPNWVGDAATNLRVVSWRWDGSILYLAATDVGT